MADPGIRLGVETLTRDQAVQRRVEIITEIAIPSAEKEDVDYAVQCVHELFASHESLLAELERLVGVEQRYAEALAEIAKDHDHQDDPAISFKADLVRRDIARAVLIQRGAALAGETT